MKPYTLREINNIRTQILRGKTISSLRSPGVAGMKNAEVKMTLTLSLSRRERNHLHKSWRPVPWEGDRLR